MNAGTTGDPRTYRLSGARAKGVAWRANSANAYLRALEISLLLYLPLWFVGLGGLYWPLIAIPAVAYLLRARMDAVSTVTLLIGVTLVISIPIGYIEYDGTTSRVISAFGTCSPWVVLAAAFHALQLIPRLHILARNIALLGIAQALVIIGSILVYPGALGVPLALPTSLPSGLESFASQRIFYQDWLDGQAFRSIGLMANPTWAGAFSFISACAAIWLIQHGKYRAIGYLALLTSPIAAFYSLSRSLWVSLAVAVVLGVLIWVRKRSRVVFFTAGVVGIIGGVAMLLVSADELVRQVMEVNNDRAGSFESRSAIYHYTLQGINKHPLPIIGYGIKPQLEGLVASLATHSTYLGMLFRGGILALGLLIGALAALLRRSIRSDNALGAAVLGFIAVWAILEDLDAGHLVLTGLLFCFDARLDSPGEERV